MLKFMEEVMDKKEFPRFKLGLVDGSKMKRPPAGSPGEVCQAARSSWPVYSAA
jgi:hypothetical protein